MDSSDKNAIEERRYEAKSPWPENERVCRKSGNPFPSLHTDDRVCKDFANSLLGSYNPFPLNILAFIVVFLMKIIGFQLSLMVSLFTFPIRLSYFSFMLLLFPFQTLEAH